MDQARGWFGFLMISMLLLPWNSFAGEQKTVEPGNVEPGNAALQSRNDYKEFSSLVHRLVVRQLPKDFEDNSGWGQTIPAPPNLRLPLLRRYIQGKDQLEVPHGAWRRFKGKLEDPGRDLKIVVKEFKQLENKNYRLVLDVDATLLCQAEWQQWQKGLLLIGAEAVADANITAAIVCDIGVILNVNKFPPELNLNPKIIDLGLDLVDFKLRNAPILLKGENSDNLRKELKEVLRSLIKAAEPAIKEQANLAIAQGLREGRGTISASTLLKSIPVPK